MRFFPNKDDRQLMNLVLRFAAGSVFLWFGVDKIVRPEAWYAWVPSWIWPFIPNMDVFMYLNGAFEVAVGLCLVTGKYVREAAILAALFVFGITMAVGVSEVTVRDLALVGICIALAIEAEGSAKRRLPQGTFAVVTGLYIFYLFIYGVLYLRNVNP